MPRSPSAPSRASCRGRRASAASICAENELDVGAPGQPLIAGRGSPHDLERRLAGRVDRSVGREQHAERLLRAPQRQARGLEQHFVGRQLLRGAQLVQPAAGAALQPRPRVVHVRPRVLARAQVDVDLPLLRDDREVRLSRWPARSAAASRSRPAARCESGPRPAPAAPTAPPPARDTTATRRPATASAAGSRTRRTRARRRAGWS